MASIRWSGLSEAVSPGKVMVTQSTIALSCQKCGGTTNAVAGQDYYHCQYCKSLLLLQDVSADRITPTGTFLDDSCPVCAQTMQTGLIEKQRVLYCMNCYGILLRHGDFGVIVAERRAQRAGMEPAEPRPIPEGSEKRRIECPTCQNRMDAHPYYGPGQVLIDTCADCGFVWLDHGELKRIEDASSTRTANSVAASMHARSDDPGQFDVSQSSESQDKARTHWMLELANLLFDID